MGRHPRHEARGEFRAAGDGRGGSHNSVGGRRHPKRGTLVGLDVHAAKVVAAILDAETGELRFERLGGETAAAVALCSGPLGDTG